MDKEERKLIEEALFSAQAALNPISGFVKVANVKRTQYLDEVRQKILVAIALVRDE